MEIVNKRARFNYFVIDEYEAGIVLTGTEIKSVRNGSCNIKDSYGIIRKGEVYLIKVKISSLTDDSFQSFEQNFVVRENDNNDYTISFEKI